MMRTIPRGETMIWEERESFPHHVTPLEATVSQVQYGLNGVGPARETNASHAYGSCQSGEQAWFYLLAGKFILCHCFGLSTVLDLGKYSL